MRAPTTSPWMADAVCAQTDPEEFFPENGSNSSRAKTVCAACPVRVECLAYAIDNDIRFGIWGGLSERERQRLRRDTDVHGTLLGLDVHRAAGEPACPRCRGALGHATRRAVA